MFDVNFEDLHRIGSVGHSCVAVVGAGNPVYVLNYRLVDLQRSNRAPVVSYSEVVSARLDGDQCGDQRLRWHENRLAFLILLFAIVRHSAKLAQSGRGSFP